MSSSIEVVVKMHACDIPSAVSSFDDEISSKIVGLLKTLTYVKDSGVPSCLHERLLLGERPKGACHVPADYVNKFKDICKTVNAALAARNIQTAAEMIDHFERMHDKYEELDDNVLYVHRERHQVHE